MSTLNISIDNIDNKKSKLAKSKILGVSHETSYLSQAGKLRIKFIPLKKENNK